LALAPGVSRPSGDERFANADVETIAFVLPLPPLRVIAFATLRSPGDQRLVVSGFHRSPDESVVE
jgi:hypothetical protein